MKSAVRLLLVMAALFALTFLAAATARGDVVSGAPQSGVVVAVQTDSTGGLTAFTIVDSNGARHDWNVTATTNFGLDNQAGDRWVSTLADAPVEAADRLLDHQRRFAPVTVTGDTGTAVSVVERESGKLETNLGYLFAVFAVTWAGFFGYMFWVSRKQRELQKEIARLRATLNRGGN